MPKLSLAKLERHLYGAADRLRQEGLDAATYKDYIFGMLFLKRCSDVFDAEHEGIVGRKVEQGLRVEEAEAKFGENPDYYDGFFVPERARWKHLQNCLGDASVPYGSVLDTALNAVSEANESLQHVLDHIEFMKVQSNKRVVSDDACKDLGKGFVAEFLVHLFRSALGQKTLELAKVGTTRSELSIAPLKRLKLACPPECEQHGIAELLNREDDVIARYERELEKVRKVKSGLMTDLPTGRVRVPEHVGVGGAN